jgi:hypothetical protein
VKSDAQICGYTPSGLVFDDGSTLDADVVIFATGFVGNPRDQVASIIGPEMEEQLEDMWQCDKEGEVRGLWKPIRRKSTCFVCSAKMNRLIPTYRSENLVRWWRHQHNEVLFALFGTADCGGSCWHTVTRVL